MRIVREDVLNVSLVLSGVQLLNKADAKVAFTRQVATEVSDAPSPSGSINISFTAQLGGEGSTHPLPPEPVGILHLNRERIRLDCFPGRSSIIKEYPQREEMDRLAEVVGIAFEQTDFDSQHIQAYGVNIDATYKLPTGMAASNFIANHLHMPNLFLDQGIEVVSGMSTLRLNHRGQRWNIRIEPRLGDLETDKLFIGLNRHTDNVSLPPRPGEITLLLNEVWDQMEAIVGSLEGRA